MKKPFSSFNLPPIKRKKVIINNNANTCSSGLFIVPKEIEKITAILLSKGYSNSSKDDDFHFRIPLDDFRTPSRSSTCPRRPFLWFPLSQTYHWPFGRRTCNASGRTDPCGGVKCKICCFRHFYSMCHAHIKKKTNGIVKHVHLCICNTIGKKTELGFMLTVLTNHKQWIGDQL